MSRIAGMNAAAAINKKLSTEDGLQEFAKIQADELALQNQAKIELAREDLSRRATGTTNYGQDVEAPVQRYIDRNVSQADVARRESLARQQGETAKGHLDRLALDPDAALNRTAMEEKTFRETNKFADRERAIREYLSRGAQNVKDPNLQRLASEFVQNYPDEYRRIKAEMRGEKTAAPMQTPEEKRAAMQQGANKLSEVEFSSMARRLGRDLTMEEEGFIRAFNSPDLDKVPPENIERLKEMLVNYGNLEVREDGSVRGAGSKGQFASSMYARLGRMTDGEVGKTYGGLPQQDVNRARSAAQRDPEGFQRFYDAADARIAGGDTRSKDIIAAELYNQQLRKERGIDPESRRARQDEVARSRAIEAISGRHGNDPAMVRRAIENWNSRNPNNPLRPDDFGMPPAGQSVTARPGEVVEVDDVRSVNPSKISAGSILVDATGPYRSARRQDGSIYGQPVLQDKNSGFYFPDPDKYGEPSKFNAAMSRQDRVNMRQAIMNSGNSVLANEQRRLDAARQAASSSIPEIREAGIKEVDELERELHWQYVTEAANLAGPASTGGREEMELGGPTTKPEKPEKAEKPITRGDVRDRIAEIMKPGSGADFDVRKRLRGMTEEEQMAEVYRMMQQDRQPYSLSDAYDIQQAGPAPQQAGPAPQQAGQAPQQAGPADQPTGEASSGYRVSPLGLPIETPDKSDSAAWQSLMVNNYGPFIDREVDKIAQLDPSQRAEALNEVFLALSDFGIDIDSAPRSVISLIESAIDSAASELGVSL